MSGLFLSFFPSFLYFLLSFFLSFFLSLDPGPRIPKLGSRIPDPKSRIPNPGSWILDLGSWAADPGISFECLRGTPVNLGTQELLPILDEERGAYEIVVRT